MAYLCSRVEPRLEGSRARSWHPLKAPLLTGPAGHTGYWRSSQPDCVHVASLSGMKFLTAWWLGARASVPEQERKVAVSEVT